MSKWEERVKLWKVELVDAIGVSPLAEMIYFWGGPRKQDAALLEKTLEILKWERVSHAEKFENNLDEKAIHDIIAAAVLRNLGRLEEARDLLVGKILNHDRYFILLLNHDFKKLTLCRQEFKGHLKDDWTCPNAHYEMASVTWKEKDVGGADEAAKVNECFQWLEKTQKWGEEYVLNSRMAVKVSTALNTVRRHKKIMGI